MPTANSGGVSNAGPVEETTVTRADGTVQDLEYPEPERVPEPDEEEPEPDGDEAPDRPKNAPRKRASRKRTT